VVLRRSPASTARTMFGSNFPIDGLYSSYDALRCLLVIIAGFDANSAMLHDNACALYRL
jgi:predicted TIM-barrel fold metal-dependent hydrolase